MLSGLAAFGILYAAQPVLPQIGAEFADSPSRASWAVAASTGGLAIAVIPAAAMALRWGRVVTLRALAGVVLAGVVVAGNSPGWLPCWWCRSC